MLTTVMHELFSYILALGFAIARIFPCLLIVPAFSFFTLKGMVRSAIIVSLSLFLVPALQPVLSVLSKDPYVLLGIAMKEIVIGMFLGILLSVPFWIFESVGALFDNQRGAMSGGQLNPALGPDVTIIGHMLQQWFIMLLMLGFGLTVMTQVIWDSYRLWPLESWLPTFSAKGFSYFLDLLADMFTKSVLFAAPLVLVLMLIDFCIGVLSVYSQQLQASTLSVPLKSIVGILFFLMYLPTLEYLANHQLASFHDLIAHLTLVFPKGGAL
ncbi:type III secretion system protein [[Pantoea] beijingensis]|uniref:Type III secretion system protein n=1 Tax=[Pantoea] beijingensis TaxID=1324864 RepID=A0A443I9Z9_9GAMM|nr:MULTISPECIES: type III secretion system export apparatus subunit SctT [Erwiniaceae]RWR00988.1 type III secretion system protein [[Pantoea] beijingensis]